MNARKQKDSHEGGLSGFGVTGGYLAGVDRSNLVPVGGCTPDRLKRSGASLEGRIPKPRLGNDKKTAHINRFF